MRTKQTYVHNIVEHDECGPPALLLISNTDLANASIPSKQVVEILASDLVVEIFYEQNPIGTRR